MRARKRRGFGWQRWSRRWLYEGLGLFDGYRVRRYEPRPKALPDMIGPITLGAKRTGKRSAGNPHAPFDVAGAGDVTMGAGLRPEAKADGRATGPYRARASPRPYRSGEWKRSRQPPRSGRPGRLPTSAPHRSGHAQLRHPAPRAMNSLRDQTDASQPSRRQRVTPLQLAETLPRDPGLARAAAEPLVPGTSHVVPEAAEARDIAGDPVIREMPPELPRQGRPLLLDRQVAVLAAPSPTAPRDRRNRPWPSCFHRPVPLERPTPVVGEPQEVERAGAFVPGARWGPRRKPLERDQPGLLRMEGQAVLRNYPRTGGTPFA